MLDLLLAREPLHNLRSRRAPALVDGRQELSYGELAERVGERVADFDLSERSLVVCNVERTVEAVVTYLALLWAGHVPLLARSDLSDVAERWDAGAWITPSPSGVVVRRRDAPPPRLHPNLALLLPTSGSTGCPKLVRLSRRNLLANACSITSYLGLGPTDRAITSLPLTYSYGLSVLHSHLLAGGSVALTESSVLDPCFRALYGSGDITNVAGVPHTYELLERGDPDWLATPSLRFMTQAGGRMAPDDVSRWLRRCHGWGAELYVMYGQTEATARIAYLPPALAQRRPEAIGRAIPGGTLALRDGNGVQAFAALPPADGAEGELVYRGPNVMMGYATSSDDLAAPGELDELATGDLARYHAGDDVFEIIGRTSRFTKLFGLRVDLDAVEELLRPLSAGPVVAVGDDCVLRIVAPQSNGPVLHGHAARQLGLPPSAVEVRTDLEVVRTASGKVDYATVAANCTTPSQTASNEVCPSGSPSDPLDAMATTVAHVLGRRAIDPDRSFVSLGGDSLSYIECSLGLEAILGPLPPDWHHQPLRDLARNAPPAPSSATARAALAQVDTTIVLRAIAICMVVSYHMDVARTPGGAHLMLAIAGYNFARFVAGIPSPLVRLRAGVRAAARVATPAVAWLAAGCVAFGSYEWSMVALVHNYLGSPTTFFAGHWAYWYVEVFLHLTVGSALLLALPPVSRLYHRSAYPLVLGLLLTALSVRSWWQVPQEWHFTFYRTHGVAWFFFLGWLVFHSTNARLRLLTSALAVMAIAGFFDSPRKESAIMAGIVLLAWRRRVPLPRLVIGPVHTLASASLWIYLTHFELWPRLAEALGGRSIAYVPTILAGVVACSLQRYVVGRLVAFRSRERSARRVPVGLVSPARQRSVPTPT